MDPKEDKNEVQDISSQEMPLQAETETNVQTTFEKVVRNFILFILVASIISFIIYGLSLLGIIKLPTAPDTSLKGDAKLGIAQFSSDEAFQKYFENAPTDSFSSISLNSLDTPTLDRQAFGQELEKAGDRVSQTNIQVIGIDEPDILKSEGNYLYYSPSQSHFRPVLFDRSEPAIAPDFPYQRQTNVKIIKSLPVNELSLSSTIDKSGKLFLSGSTLIVFEASSLIGYDVADKTFPRETWRYELGKNNQLLDARLHNGTIYIMVQNYVSRHSPCPIILREGSKQLSMPCTDVYYPTIPVPADSTFSVIGLQPETGDVTKKVSFVGKTGSSIVYMSANNIYITYQFTESPLSFMYDFFVAEASDLIPQAVLGKLDALKNYDISEQSKITEMGVILDEYHRTLSDDERLKLDNELQNRLGNYTKLRSRNFEKTGIVKLKNDDLFVQSTGMIAGRMLNQFSFDEYDGYLRVATTVGSSWFGGETANDVYILNANLEKVGEILDLGLSERIFSVRFVGKYGYVVTFKQIDPFYVLDLSNPRAPVKKGELKIPGYSSYLHPLNDTQLVGVGVEEGILKLSLFDVTNPNDPKELDKYTLNEYGSETLTNHHAFLHDSKYKVVFIPASQGGYVFSYAGNSFELKRAISGFGIERAAYVNDILYVIGTQKIVALSENDWTTLKELSLD